MIDRRFLLVTAAAVAASRPHLGYAKSLAPVTVMLDWLLNPNHAALCAAAQTGAFARAGLDVTLVSPSDPDSPCRLVAAGQADLAVSYGSQINMITSAGLPLVRIATLVDRPLNTIMARSDLATLTDLKGKTIGYSVSGVEEAILAVMLASAGIDGSEVTTVKVNYNMVTAMLTRRLDAAIGAYRNAEVIEIEQLGEKPSVFLPERHGVPLYDELILVARRDRLTDPRLKNVVQAIAASVGVLKQNPDYFWQAFATAHPELNTPTTRLSWQATIPLLASDPITLNRERYLAFQEFARREHIIPTAQKLDAFAAQIA